MNRGVAETHGAITFVNALPTGIGCAAAVQLVVRAEVELRSEGLPDRPGDAAGRHGESPLVHAAVQEGLRVYGGDPSLSAALHLHSEVPVARGLKSSSAVSSAVLLAIARAAGRSPPLEDVARTSARVSREVGVSATGAFDDALASLQGGVVVTDNRGGTVVRVDDVPPSWRALLLIPESAHAPSPALAARFSAHADVAERAARAAREGRFLVAMRENTALVEEAMGYEYASLRTALETAGALASGVSGMGPTLVAVVDEQNAGRVHGIARSIPMESRLVEFVRATTQGNAG